MRVLVTAGGLSEPIDDVRSVTNTSTGKLGTLVADAFVQANASVTFLHARGSKTPSEKCELIQVQTAKDTLQKIDELLSKKQYDVCVHAMAVSDFEVKSVEPKPVDGKISSSTSEVTIKLQKTPKIISTIKQISPKIHLVGFKLLAKSTSEQLISAARDLSIENSCDFVVANRLEDINNSKHIAYFVDKKSAILAGNTKQEVASSIVARIIGGI